MLPGLPGMPEDMPEDMPDFHFFDPDQQEDFFTQGAGSGFVWDKEGHIVTNNHVVANAESVDVTFSDGTILEGEVVGTDPDSDLAVVKVERDADELQPIEVVDSSNVKVGHLSIAIGNPFGLEGTMTVGFVSALGRSLPVESSMGPSYTIPDIIQTDASINPGNSGGVLVNDKGQLIGVPSAIQSPIRASAGVGFAIPSSIVQQVVPVLIEEGSYDHSWIGITGTTLTPDLAEAMGLEKDQRGALVIEVANNGPADEAGLQGSDEQISIDGVQARVGGDIITAFDGRPVREFDDLVAYLARHTQVGQTVTLTILRDGEKQEIDVTLGSRPGTTETPEPQEEQASADVWLGIQGRTLTTAIAEAMDLSARQKGVLVSQVENNSPADEAGLRGSYKSLRMNGEQVLIGGDVITAVDDQEIESIEELQTAINRAEAGDEVTLTLLRNGEETSVEVTLAERPE
jgi:S1-C subfamily serine protease